MEIDAWEFITTFSDKELVVYGNTRASEPSFRFIEFDLGGAGERGGEPVYKESCYDK